MKRVYFVGRLGDADFSVIDADEPETRVAVRSINLCLGAHGKCTVRLGLFDGLTIDCEVVQPPKHPLAGKRVLMPSLIRSDDVSQTFTTFTGQLAEFQVRDDGTLSNASAVHRASAQVSGQQYLSAKDPSDVTAATVYSLAAQLLQHIWKP